MKHVDSLFQFLPSNGVILDVGSGRGKFLCEMAGLGFKAFGVEVNPDYIVETENRAKEGGVAVNVQRSSAEALPFSDNYFDFINCAEVTEHVENPQKVCQEICRVLKIGGRGYISFHNRFGIFDYHYHMYFINWLPRSWAEAILKFLKKEKIDSIIGRQKLSTMHYFTYNEAVEFFKNNNFDVVDIREKKIKEAFPFLSPLLLVVYHYLLRPIYFNTFHLLIIKN